MVLQLVTLWMEISAIVHGSICKLETLFVDVNEYELWNLTKSSQ